MTNKKLVFDKKLFLFLLGGAVIGFSLGLIFAGRSTGEQGILPSCIFFISHYKIHLHHWIFSMVGVFTLLIVNYFKKILKNPYWMVLMGIFIGLILHGILWYSDWYIFVINTTIV